MPITEPSLAPRMMASAPTRPPAPTRFSTITCPLSCLASSVATMRAPTSVTPPAAKGTTRLIGRSCARAGPLTKVRLHTAEKLATADSTRA